MRNDPALLGSSSRGSSSTTSSGTPASLAILLHCRACLTMQRLYGRIVPDDMVQQIFDRSMSLADVGNPARHSAMSLGSNTEQHCSPMAA